MSDSEKDDKHVLEYEEHIPDVECDGCGKMIDISHPKGTGERSIQGGYDVYVDCPHCGKRNNFQGYI